MVTNQAATWDESTINTKRVNFETVTYWSMFKVAAKCMEYKKVQNSNETMDANKEKAIYKKFKKWALHNLKC